MARRLILSYFTVHLRLLTQFIPPALPLENIPKSLIFECFQGVCKETIDMKWVKELTFTCSKSTKETLEKEVKYVQT